MWWGGGGSDPDPVEEVGISFVSYYISSICFVSVDAINSNVCSINTVQCQTVHGAGAF